MSTTVEVFEHETLHVGRPLRTIDGREVRLTDRHFDDLVRFNDTHGGRFFKVGHRRISMTEHVGYVEVGNLAIEILPKADRTSEGRGTERAWRDVLLEMLSVASGLRLELPTSASQRTGRSSLLELVAARFVEEVNVLLHQGLAKGYRDDEQNGPTFRGRLVVAEHLRANIARGDRFYVRTQTYDPDTALNRILGAALDEVSELGMGPGIAARVAECRASFPDVREMRVTGETFDRVRLGRTTARYENALVLARMLLEHSGPQLRAGRSKVFALLFDMNVLWERYVVALFRRAARDGLEVSTQERHPFWRGGVHRRGVRPDIVVRARAGKEVLLIADTKWKVIGDGPPGDDDLQQMFVYNELLGGGRAVLIYPGAGGASGGSARGDYVGRTHGCETVQLALVEAARSCTAGMREHVISVLTTLGTDTPTA